MSVAVTITGTGNRDYCSVTIAGTMYTTATTGLEVQTGDSIKFNIRGSSSGGTGKITIDGEVVTSSSNLTARSYTWTVPAGISVITIALSSSPQGVITVTTGEPKTHRTLIDGVGYNISAGRCLVDGVGYSIKKGRTLIDGVGYDV